MAVAAANCINIPIIRQRYEYSLHRLYTFLLVHFLTFYLLTIWHYSELVDGIPVTDKSGELKIGESTVAAKSAITKVALSRICMAVPGMGNDKSPAQSNDCPFLTPVFRFSGFHSRLFLSFTVLPPILMNYLDTKTLFFKRYPWAPAPLQIAVCGACLGT